ncbi:MAG TPA: diaminopimelate decarboxylase [Myxococcaceae bacterium]|nr:diaminopimelate decarboxylase [Myxococcaceae bacterium]
MDHFRYRRGALHAERVPLSRIAARLGTPTYVYAEATLRRHWEVVSRAFAGRPTLVCYSVKASSNLALLARFAAWGAGFDIVSGGELARVRRAGGDPRRTVFAGVGKTRAELEQALRAKVLLFNVESAEELQLLDQVARGLGVRAPFAIRVNPGVDPRTHHAISTGLLTSKFGVPLREAYALYQQSRRMRGLVARGVDCHIGSQLTDTRPLREAVTQVARLYQQLLGEGLRLSLLDVGGGLGIPYRGERPPGPEAWARTLRQATAGLAATLLVEPGRVLVGNAGVLLTRVLFRKRARTKQFVIVDAGMNDLLRPSLYQAFHRIEPVGARGPAAFRADVVGPVCETGDFLARDRDLPAVEPEDVLAVRDAGAYGYVMASNYNLRPRPAEVLVEDGQARLIRRRETFEDLVRTEQ